MITNQKCQLLADAVVCRQTKCRILSFVYLQTIYSVPAVHLIFATFEKRYNDFWFLVQVIGVFRIINGSKVYESIRNIIKMQYYNKIYVWNWF